MKEIPSAMPAPSKNSAVETRCGSVAIVGPTNAGKSTLINYMVGQKVTITSPKAQTTRTRLMGIAMAGSAQIMLVDTPGMFEPRRRLDRAMLGAIQDGVSDADLILVLLDARGGITARAERLFDALSAQQTSPQQTSAQNTRKTPMILALNKVDAVTKSRLPALAQDCAARAPFTDIFMISALTGDGVDDLKARLAQAMPPGPWHFPPDQVSNRSSRFLAEEITREHVFRLLHEELPYAAHVETERWKELKNGAVRIDQKILIERESQRMIVIGKNGSKIKEIGQKSREDIARELDRPVQLFLHVSIDPRWAERREVYHNLGLDWSS